MIRKTRIFALVDSGIARFARGRVRVGGGKSEAMLRTPNVTVGKDFEFVGSVTKAFVDSATGERHIRGVASGIAIDRDGERVSKRAISSMEKQIASGEVKFTAGHSNDWLHEMGDVVAAEVDKETDELIIDAKLPPEGIDPIADKGWGVVNKESVGFSIGGKLESAYHELNTLGKKTKVLDAIRLNHICLTKKPSYSQSFAEAVAKTFDGPEPDESEFTLDEDLSKDTTTGSWVSGGGGNSGQDSQTGSQRNAGTKKKGAKSPNVQDEKKSDNEDDDDEKSLDEASRHLSCPNCGHEFGAEIPVDMTPEEREKQDKEAAQADNRNDRSGKATSKSEEATMDLEKRVKELEDLVAKQATEDAKEPAETVAKAEGVDENVLKVIALATGDQADLIEKTRTEMSEGLEIVGKAIMEVREALGNLPTGRKSVARILPATVGHDSVEKTTEDEVIEKSEDPVEVIKALNAKTYGIV